MSGQKEYLWRGSVVTARFCSYECALVTKGDICERKATANRKHAQGNAPSTIPKGQIPNALETREKMVRRPSLQPDQSLWVFWAAPLV